MQTKTERLPDEFHPGHCKISFFYVPQSIAAMSHLSEGAKLLYGTLFTLGQTKGKAFAGKEYLQEHLGNPSKSTLYRWQKELMDEGLIRVLQRGRGMTNIYYFLRHPALGNAEVGEFESGSRPLYRDRQNNTQTIVTEEEGLYIFEERLREWYEVNRSGGFMEFPKPGIKLNASKRRELETEWQQRLADAYVNATTTPTPSTYNAMSNTTSIEDTETQVLSTSSTTEPIEYDSIFTSNSSSTAMDERAMKMSDEPVTTILPTGQVIYGPSPRACFLAEMKRREKKEKWEKKLMKERMTAT